MSLDEKLIGICVGTPLLNEEFEIDEIIIYEFNEEIKEFVHRKSIPFELKDACV